MKKTLLETITPLPLIAILRGLTLERTLPTAEVLVTCGLTCLEVPLNSPNPLQSIEKMATELGESVLVGAGTVLSVADAQAVIDSGGRLIVMPHTDTEIIEFAKQKGIYVLPGALTPTEGFSALKAGADGLKLFPSDLAPPSVIKALKVVFPAETDLFPVGGIHPNNMKEFWNAGASGFGIGSALFQPDFSIELIKKNTITLIERFNDLLL